MKKYVIGEDKSLNEAYDASEIDEKLQPISTNVANNTAAIEALKTSASNTRKITAGAAAPTGGSNGDIYIQY